MRKTQNFHKTQSPPRSKIPLVSEMLTEQVFLIFQERNFNDVEAYDSALCDSCPAQ